MEADGVCVQPVSSHMILSIHTRFELIHVLPLNAVRCYTILFWVFFAQIIVPIYICQLFGAPSLVRV